MYVPNPKMTRQLMLDKIDQGVLAALMRDRLMATGAYAGMPIPKPPRRRAGRERQARERRLAEIAGHETKYATA